MATKTLGTNANNTLKAIFAAMGGSTKNADIPGNFGEVSAADFATIQEAILNDKVNGNPMWPGALTKSGLLFVPNRGVLQVLPGDWIGVDATGWPTPFPQMQSLPARRAGRTIKGSPHG